MKAANISCTRPKVIARVERDRLSRLMNDKPLKTKDK